MDAVAAEEITFSAGRNPLPYAPAYDVWSDHVVRCAQCTSVDAKVSQGEPARIEDLCVPGAALQIEVQYAISDQYAISSLN